MAQGQKTRTVYGPYKYAAFHLLLARWIRHYALVNRYRYVTLGGTELRDVLTMFFIDPELASRAVSFESNHERYLLAERAAQRVQSVEFKVETVERDFFDFERDGNEPHLFFLDLEGICGSADYPLRFAEMFRKGILKENDTIFITSYLGRNPGWNRLFQGFDAEFRILGIGDSNEKKTLYRRAHPSFTLFRALSRADLQNELSLNCFGCVEYRDTSPMGLYGYVVAEGFTLFPSFIRNTPYFHVNNGGD